MKIATFNTNSVRARLPIIRQWLETHRPDVLCLQEIKVATELFPRADFEDLGYHLAISGQKAYSGVAFASLLPAENVTIGLDDNDPDPARLIAADFGPLRIVNAYVPQGQDPESDKFQYKLAWYDRILEYFHTRHSPDDKILWTGDLNIAPTSIDVHSPKKLWGHVCYHPEVQKKLGAVMAWGLVDVFRKHHPEPDQYTYFDYRAKNPVEMKKGWRIDHMLATSPLAALSTDSYIDLEPRLLPRPSDHTFLVAEFDL